MIKRWNGKSVRFIEKADGWWAAIDDVMAALDCADADYCADTMECIIDGEAVKVISVKDIYRLLLASKTKDGVQFRAWVCNIIDLIRDAAGYKQDRVTDFVKAMQKNDLDINTVVEALRNPEGLPYIVYGKTPRKRTKKN
jgi:prophage antirepressor-like protein